MEDVRASSDGTRCVVMHRPVISRRHVEDIPTLVIDFNKERIIVVGHAERLLDGAVALPVVHGTLMRLGKRLERKDDLRVL